LNTINTPRINFASIKNQVNYPDFLDIQLVSFQSFFQTGTTLDERINEGLYKTFTELFPITDSRNNFVLEFIDYIIDPPRYSIEECINRGSNTKLFLESVIGNSSVNVLYKPSLILSSKVVPV
jgi:DNA-directed RNA polymerase subunit beta